MAKPDDKNMTLNADVPIARSETAEFPLSLDEFCARLSQADKRVELIAGFHASERADGRIKDMEANFRKRFDAYMKKPVG